MSRPVPEWTGKHHGVNIPPRVRLRVFDAHNGVCHICKIQIKPIERWQADHVIALINGGEHREGNLAPVHSHCHVGKTARDVKEKAKTARVRQKHTGATRPTGKLRGQPFPTSQKRPRIDKSALPALPLSPLMRSALK